MSLDKRFLTNIIRNSYITSSLVGVIMYLVRAHVPERFAEGFTFGAFCGVTNFVFLGIVIRSVVTSGKSNGWLAFAGLAGLMGVLVAYCFVFVKHWFNDISMVIGFSYIFGVIVVSTIIKSFEKGSDE